MPKQTAIHRFAMLVTAYAAFVIFAGAMVKSTGSGMAVPDWPLSFGQYFPKMEGGVFYEHGHRMLAGVLGLIVLGLAVWGSQVEARPAARWLLWGALLSVVVQAGLGGITVLIGTQHGWDHTHPVITTMHACLAQALLAALVAYGVISSQGWQKAMPATGARGLASKGAALVALAFIQIVLGAVMRNQGAGLVIYDFPLSYGRLIPEFHNALVALNFSHRVGGWALALFGIGFAWKIAAMKDLDAWARQPAKVLLAAIGIQFLLGACVVWTKLTLPLLTSVHVLGGSVVLASSVVLALRLKRVEGR